MITGRQFAEMALSFSGTEAEEQKVFCQMDKAIYPVPNKWGEKGATTFDLASVPRNIVLEALLSGYNAVINSKAAPWKKRAAPKKSGGKK